MTADKLEGFKKLIEKSKLNIDPHQNGVGQVDLESYNKLINKVNDLDTKLDLILNHVINNISSTGNNSTSEIQSGVNQTVKKQTQKKEDMFIPSIDISNMKGKNIDTTVNTNISIDDSVNTLNKLGNK